VLYDLVVSPWPLILWVAFRTMVKDQTDILQTFLDILAGRDSDLFAWDDDDEFDLLLIVAKGDGQLGLYPQDWNGYMVELDLKTWLKINNMTRRTCSRPRHGHEDLNIRLAAVSLIYSGTSIVSQNILAPLDITLDDFPFATMARVVDQNYKEQFSQPNFESEEFWSTPNLEN
jgi:hypothetical protein